MIPVKTDLIKTFFDQYHVLSDSEFERFKNYIRLVTLKPKQKLTKEGEVEQYLYFVVEGILRKYFRNGKQEIATGFFTENQLCHASISYFTGSPSSVILEAIEPTTCFAIHRNGSGNVITGIART